MAAKKKLEIERPVAEPAMETMAFRISPSDRELLGKIKVKVKAKTESEALRFAIQVLARELGLVE